MTEKVKILGISGSLRQGSYNTAALHAAVELCPDDAEIQVYDIAGFEQFNQDREANPPEKVIQFKAAIRAADAVLFSSPEYNYSVPGVLKNAIDWASRPYGDSAWDGKPALIMGASGGAVGTARMQYHLRQIMVFLNMFPLNRPEVMINNCVGKFDKNLRLNDEATREYLKEALEALVHWTRRLKS